MRSLLLPLSAVCIAAVATPSHGAAPNLISNGSFEIVTPGTTPGGICFTNPGSPYAVCAATGWSGTYQIGNGGASGVPNGVNNSFYIPQPDPDGVNALILQAGPATATATESFAVGSGGTYDLSFYLANRSTPGYNGAQTVAVLFDNAPIAGGRFTGLSTAWTLESLSVTAGAGTHTLTFEGLGNGGQDVTAFVDNVVLTSPVPEPGSFVLLGCGLLALASRSRARRS